MRVIPLLQGILLVGLLLSGCRWIYPPDVAAAVICTQVDAYGRPLDASEHFYAEAPALHCSVRVENVRPGRRLEAVFVSVDAVERPDFIIDRREAVTSGSNYYAFCLRRDERLWPAGHYRVDIYLDDELEHIVSFEVLPSASTPTATFEPSPTPTATPSPSIRTFMARSTDVERERGRESVTYAPTDSAFFCIVEAAHVPMDTVFSVTWIALDAATDPNTEIQTTKRRFAGEGRIAFKLPRADEPWPQGHYQAKVRVDGAVYAVHEFSVSKIDETTKEGVLAP